MFVSKIARTEASTAPYPENPRFCGQTDQSARHRFEPLFEKWTIVDFEQPV